jgi:hypothetical protein
MPPTTVQSLITASGSSDLAPLAANDTFTRIANVELAARDANAAAAEAAVARTEEVSSAVNLFASAMRSVRAVAKRFPETSKFTDEAAKQLSLAMSAVAYNPQPLPTDAKPTPTTTLRPLPATTATGTVPVAPAPPAAPTAPVTK